MVRVNILKTNNHPALSDLFVEVEEAQTRKPVAAFASLKAAAQWLKDEGYEYVHGTNGIWAKA